MAHSMVGFSAVAIVLAIGGIGVRFHPWSVEIEPHEATVTGTLADQEPAARPETGSQLRWERGTTLADLEPTNPVRVPLEVPTPGEARAMTPAQGEPPTGIIDGVERHAAIEQREAPSVIADRKAIQSRAVGVPPAQSASLRPLSSLTGVWTLETEVESSSLKAFEGLRLGYRLELRQKGDRIEGTGQKVTENGLALSGARRTAITVHGTLAKGRMRLTFGEQGAARNTTGTLDLEIDENGVLRGVFASEAARSAGAVEARRL